MSFPHSVGTRLLSKVNIMDIIPTINIEQDFSTPQLKLPKLPDGDFYQFHTTIKPSGSQCNLDCTYCFYLHKETLLQQPKRPRMSEALLELYIKQYIEAQTGPSVEFTWQGGEPTLMGIDFFEKVIEIQNKYKKANQEIFNDLQTNGTLLNDEWCQFLKKHNFLVGLSIDGPAEYHDKYRYSKTKQPTFERVMKAVALLHKHNVPFNALCVVNRDNAKAPLDVYRFLRDKVKPQLIQFIPGIETKDFHSVAPQHWPEENLPVIGSPASKPGTVDSVVSDWSVDADDWGMFLNTIWDEWFQRDFGNVFVDQFENVISLMFGYGPQKCVNSEVCGKALAIEHNGDLYSCDHFVYPEFKLGNIQQVHQGDLMFSERQKQFAYAKSDQLPAYCKSCSYLKLCWGECPKNRFIKTPDGEQGLSYLCSGLKRFYSKVTNNQAELQRRLNVL